MKTFLLPLLIQLLVLVLISYPAILFAQTKLKQRSITKIQLRYDTNRVNGIENSFSIHLLVERHNGKQASIQGYNNGILTWDQFKIRVENGAFQNGTIHYNWKKVYQNGHQITVHISPKNNPNLNTVFYIPIPYLTRMSFQPAQSLRVKPGYPYPLDIQGFYSNGKVYSTSATWANTHKLSQADFRLNYQQYSSRNNNVFIPTRLEPYPDSISITCTYLVDTTLTIQTRMPVDYTSHYTLNFIPEKASRGDSGENAVGCNRRNGRDGQDGQHGQRGLRGTTVKLYAHFAVVKSDTLIKIKAISTSQSEHILLHPTGSLVIDCRGGDGGDGGSGGNGSSGEDETEKEPAGYGGNGGNGGDGGDGGEGGRVVIYTDSVTLPFIEKMVTIENKGGKGGQGGVGGKRGRGGLKVKDTSFLTALGNLLGADSGNSGNTGYSGQDGERGLDKEVILLSEEKLLTHF